MAALSCSKGVFNDDDTLDKFQNDLTLVISGTASDKSSGTPLEGIRIRLYAAEDSENGEGTAKTGTAYTDSQGQFTISAGGFSRPVTCTLAAEDPHEKYDIQKLLKLDDGYMGIHYNILYFYVCFKISIIESFKMTNSSRLSIRIRRIFT